MSELIYAVDEDDETWYVLCRGGHFVAAAAWPHPLEAAYPDAIRAGTLGSENARHALAPGMPLELHDGADLYQDLLRRVRELK